jgi:hypothetical protein
MARVHSGVLLILNHGLYCALSSLVIPMCTKMKLLCGTISFLVFKLLEKVIKVLVMVIWLIVSDLCHIV